MSHTCQCGEAFETLTRKRLHQRRGCSGEFDQIEAADRDSDDVAEDTAEALLTCQQCEELHDGEFLRSDDMTAAGYTLEVRFQCEACTFQNCNTAAFEGGVA